MSYSKKVFDHFENPRNVGSFNRNDIDVGTGISGFPDMGAVIKLQIRVNDNTIIDAKFKTYGCTTAIASSSLITEWLKNKSLDEALTITHIQIAEDLNLPPVKIYCSILAESAIRATIENYKSKHISP